MPELVSPPSNGGIAPDGVYPEPPSLLEVVRRQVAALVEYYTNPAGRSVGGMDFTPVVGLGLAVLAVGGFIHGMRAGRR